MHGGEKTAKWVLESACTSHMANNRLNSKDFRPLQQSVQVGNKKFLSAEGFGTVETTTVVNPIQLHFKTFCIPPGYFVT